MSNSNFLLAIAFAAMIGPAANAAVCLGGKSDNWVNVEVCDESGYCQSICITQETWDKGDGEETAASFIHTMSQRRVPMSAILQDSDQWTDRGKWKKLNPVVIWVEFCQQGMPGSSLGNICK